jgi:hypothetical protein
MLTDTDPDAVSPARFANRMMESRKPEHESGNADFCGQFVFDLGSLVIG